MNIDEPAHLAFMVLGASLGGVLLLFFLFWWFVFRLEHRISTLVSREMAAVITQINSFREEAVAEARLAVSSARTSHALLLRVEQRVDDMDRRLLALEYPDGGPRSGDGPLPR